MKDLFSLVYFFFILMNIFYTILLNTFYANWKLKIQFIKNKMQNEENKLFVRSGSYNPINILVRL